MKVGLVGCGHIAGTHLAGWSKAKGADVTHVFDVSHELATKRAKEFGIEKVSSSLDELCREVDVIDVCTPPFTHFEVIKTGLELGCHVLAEKPLVLEVEHWEKISSLLEDKRLKMSVVHNIKFTRSLRQAKEWIDKGRIGKIIRIERYFLTDPKGDRMLAGDKHWSHRLPGGRWLETLPHELYTTHWLVGPLDLANVTTLRTSTAPAGAPADEVQITLVGEEVITTFHYSGNCGINKRTITITGSKGAIDVDILSDSATLSTVTDTTRVLRGVGLPFMRSGQVLAQMVPDRGAYMLERVQKQTPHATLIEDFVAYLEWKGPIPTPVEEIDYVVRNCELVWKAIDASAKAL